MEVLSLESVDSTEKCEQGSTLLNLYLLNVRFKGFKGHKKLIEKDRTV